MLEIAGFCLLGIIAGVMSGLVGIGGATIIITFLTLAFGFDQKLAQGTSLMLMIPPIGILAAREYYKSRNINIKAAIIMAIFFFVGGLLGGKIAVNLDSTLLKKIFAVFLLGIGIKTLFETLPKSEGQKDG